MSEEMSGYTKLFSTILASTVWREPNHVRIVWITLLAMADRDGVAEGSIPGVADFARVSIDDCRDALNRLADPDRDSRSQDFEGRRIEPIAGGWLLLNHAKYRATINRDERREYLRIKKAESRARQRASQQTSEMSKKSTQAEAEAVRTSDEVRKPPNPLKKGVVDRQHKKRTKPPITALPPDYSNGRAYVQARQRDRDKDKP
jgi:hypothetical protein